MSPTHQRIWSAGQWLVIIGFLGAIILGLAVTGPSRNAPEAVSLAQETLGWAFVAGCFILWGYALRFYFRIEKSLGVPRSALYLAIVIGLNMLAPVAFMILEGPKRFFAEALH